MLFYDGSTGRLVRAVELDPRDVVPYDSEAYSGVPRNRFALVQRPNLQSVGSLLDIWHAARFDADTGTLLLATYRPTGPPFREGDQLLCEVTQRRVAVTLVA